MRTIVLLILTVACVQTSYGQSLNMPAPTRNTGTDEIRTSSGSSCRSAVGSNTNLDFGIVASDGSAESRYQADQYRDFREGNQGNAVFFRISHALGAKKRIDCNHMYNLELETLRTELEMLKAQSFVLD